MKKLITALFSGMLLLGSVSVAIGAEDTIEPELTGVEIFELSDLKVGMKGTALTVIRGTEIEEFNVEVLERIPDGGFDGGPMILARFTGEVVDFSDGIAGGYSGSPVYIDGKLLGAVSMAMPFTDTHVGGITPIRQMMKSLPDSEEPDYSGNTVLPEPEDSGIPLDKDGNVISFVDDYEAAREYNDSMLADGRHRYAAVPARTPLYFSGISPAVLSTYGDQLRSTLGDGFEVMEMPVGKARDHGLFLRENGDAAGLFHHEESNEPPLVPGDTCVVTLAEGDVELFGLGTVTYTDTDNRFLIFGHGMFGEGTTAVPIGKGYVTWVYGSIMRAFKAGVRLNTLGTLTRDKAAACGGRFDIEADMIPVRLKIKDTDLVDSVTKRFKVVRHRDYTPMLVSMGLSQAATEVMDRRPSGTLKLSYHIEGVGLKEPLRRTNYFYDDYSVFSNGSFELMPIADLLANNIYREVKITKIDILAEITRNRINASIDDAEIMSDDEENGVDLRQGLDEDEGAVAEEPEAGPDTDEEDNEDAEDAVEPELIPADEAAVMVPGGLNWRPNRRYAVLSKMQQPNFDEEAGEEGMAGPSMYDVGGEVPTFAPGETIRVRVLLQPFREDAVWREFSIDVPDDYVSGITMLYVHGGGDLMSWNELGGKGRSLFGMGPVIDLEDRDLDAILDQIVNAPLNNELLLTLSRPYDYSQEINGENGEEDNPLEEEPEPTTDAVYQMEWVVYNSYMLPVNILTDEDAAEMEAMEEQMDGNGMEDDGEAEDMDMPYEDEEEYETELPF